MKTHINNLLFMPVLIAALGLIMAGPVAARTFTTLYSFTFKVVPDSDGAGPYASLILSGNTLYGTTVRGGSSGRGTVFAVNTDGTGFTTLYSFTGFDDGAWPYCELILSGNTLFGTTFNGGSSGSGTVFAVNTDGTGFTNLHTFTSLSAPYTGTNSDGAGPLAGLILSSNTLYGTTRQGGSSGKGTVFAVNTDGTNFANLHSFNGTSDGAGPEAGLILSGNTLYGTANGGGRSDNGTVFAVNTDGTGFTALYSFTAASGAYPHYVNSDGAYPQGGVILSGNTLYGTARQGGSSGGGTVFEVNTDGTGFANLHSFTAFSNGNSDGGLPAGGLILSGNILYGTAWGGGSLGDGTMFSLSLPTPPPQLTIIPSEANVILTWPTNAAGFTLQSTTNLGSAAVWTTNSPAPVLVNGQNTVTNPISGAQQFYRLSQ
jgi:uncharacterized repeat protein (TIGR03803 family)